MHHLTNLMESIQIKTTVYDQSYKVGDAKEKLSKYSSPTPYELVSTILNIYNLNKNNFNA